MSGKVILLPISSILFQHLVPDTKQKKPQLMLNLENTVKLTQ